MAKIQISIDDKLLKRVDAYADENYQSRSGLITVACVEYLNARETMGLVRNLSLAIKKIADTGNVSEEALQAMEDFERFVKYVPMSATT